MAVVNLSGSMKTAIILFSLSEEEAASIFRFLDQRDISRVRECLPKLEKLSPEIISAVLKEFVELTGTDHLIGSEDYLKRLLSKAVGEKRAEVLVGENVEANFSFEMLDRVDSKSLARFLTNEHPQTVSLILSFLEPKHGADVVKLLPEQVRGEIMQRIATLEPVAPEVLEEVSNIICQELQETTSVQTNEAGGLDTAAEILNQLDKANEELIIGALEESAPDIAEEIRKRMFVFEDLMHVNAVGIQALLKEVNNDELAIAMKSASGTVKDLFFDNMSERASEMLREDLDALGPLRLSEVEKAQQNIIRVARRLEDEGKILISRGGEDDLVV